MHNKITTGGYNCHSHVFNKIVFVDSETSLMMRLDLLTVEAGNLHSPQCKDRH
ncbi:MAG: hypothetical protein ABIU77_15240 [Ferruginibacter sp.]